MSYPAAYQRYLDRKVMSDVQNIAAVGVSNAPRAAAPTATPRISDDSAAAIKRVAEAVERAKCASKHIKFNGEECQLIPAELWYKLVQAVNSEK